MKNRIKEILIILLILSNIWFVFFNDKQDFSKDNQKLLNEIELIQKERDSLKTQRDSLEKGYVLLETEVSEKENKILSLNNTVNNLKGKLNDSKSELEKSKSNSQKTKNMILELEENPTIKSEDDLLNSITNNLELDNPLKPLIDEEGKLVGATLTIDQLQKIDNDYQLLELYKKLNLQCEEKEFNYIKVVNDLEEIVGTLEIKNKTFEEINSSQKEMIENLKSQVENWKKDVEKCDLQSSKKSEIISNQQDEIKKLKTHRAILVGIVVVITALSIF
jgi:predicted RNase H-like nuclease (RuvC/YqgF family)